MKRNIAEVTEADQDINNLHGSRIFDTRLKSWHRHSSRNATEDKLCQC